MKTLLFMDPTGIVPNRKVNTFRVGTKWFEQLRAGEIIELAFSEEARAFSIARVVGVHCAPWRQLQDLVPENYIAPAKPSDLMEDLLRSYPSMLLTDPITVIEFVSLL